LRELISEVNLVSSSARQAESEDSVEVKVSTWALREEISSSFESFDS